MRRVLPQWVALAALILVVVFLGQESSAENLNALKGRYAFTLAEKCARERFSSPSHDPLIWSRYGTDAPFAVKLRVREEMP